MKNVNLGQIFTRRLVADYMVSLFTLDSDSLVLDPCFGEGVFIDSIRQNTDFSINGYEIDKSLFLEYKEIGERIGLYNSDYLLNKSSIKYDGIIMNPPYIRHEKIDDLEHLGITKRFLQKEDIFRNLPKTANLYMYFIVKAISQLKDNGELIVIFPANWLTTKSGVKFKNFLEEECSIIKRIHVGGRAFEKDALVDVVVLKLIKGAGQPACEPEFINVVDNALVKGELSPYSATTGFNASFSSYAYL